MGIEAFRKLSYGLYIVSSMKDSQINGQIANALFQVTSKPPTVAVSISKENLTHSYIQASRKFSISILSRNTPMTFIGLFGFRSGKNMNKFESVNYKSGTNGRPRRAPACDRLYRSGGVGRTGLRHAHNLYGPGRRRAKFSTMNRR